MTADAKFHCDTEFDVTPVDPKRAAYTSGLRKLADLLDAHPEVPLPYTGAGEYGRLMWILQRREGQRALLAKLARLFPGQVNKNGRDEALDLEGRLDGLHVLVIADRDEVCERVVVGTEEVTKTIQDPNVVVPTVEVTETVDVVEWRCGPLLAPAEGGDAR